MITEKVLIFTNYPLNTTDAGPSGFIAQNLLEQDSKFYEISGTKSLSNLPSSKIWRKAKQLLNLDYKYAIKAGLYKAEKFSFWCLEAQKHFINIKAKDYKFIYFHDVLTMKACLPLLGSKQVTLLQSHCPELPSEEIASNPLFSNADVEFTKEAERDAFSRADILIFPNHYVETIYTSLIANKSKILYISSGCKQVFPLMKYPLGNQIYLLYIGRRNKVKGFDIVLEGFRSAYAYRKDITLILAGKGEKIDEEGIYDIGFSYSIHQWIYNCDYVLNCNRQSYFDLAVLETLSIGTPIILSGNYGHRQIAEDGSSGIIDIGQPTVENLKNALLSLDLRKKKYNQDASEDNICLYQNKYSDIVYRKNFHNLLLKILNTQ